jgi:hypothetical protein
MSRQAELLPLTEEEQTELERLSRSGKAEQPVGWGFLLKWVAATIGGSLIGLVWMAVLLVPSVFVATLLTNPYATVSLWVAELLSIATAIGEIVMGIVLGSAQSLVLHPYIPHSKHWFFASIAGWATSGLFTVACGLAAYESGEGLLLLIPLLLGAFVGAAQWFVLRHRVKHAGWWIPVNVIGIYSLGIITGGVLIWLLRHPISSATADGDKEENTASLEE